MVLFTWRRKLAWAVAFINFPFLFSPTTCLSWHGEGPFWAQQVVLCAWHRLKLVQVSGGPFCSFATADVCRSKKTALSHLLFMFVRSLVFLYAYFSQVGKETSANYNINVSIKTRFNPIKQHISECFSLSAPSSSNFCPQCIENEAAAQWLSTFLLRDVLEQPTVILPHLCLSGSPGSDTV